MRTLIISLHATCLTMFQASKVAEPRSPCRAEALIRAALVCLEMGHADKAVALALQGWNMGCELVNDVQAAQALGRTPKPDFQDELGTKATAAAAVIREHLYNVTFSPFRKYFPTKIVATHSSSYPEKYCCLPLWTT
jgi:hypothetical protein